MNFFLLVLEVPLNFSSDIIYKYSKLSKALFEKNLKLILSERSIQIIFGLDFGLFLAKVSLSQKNKTVKEICL